MAKKKTAKEKEKLDKKKDTGLVEKLTDDETSSEELTKRSFFSNPKVIIGLIVVALLALAVWQMKSLFVAAMVNNEPITRLELLDELEKTYGSQVLDNMVSQKLVEQEAKNRGVSVSDEELNTRIDEIRGNIEQSGSSLEDALAMQGQTEDDLREGVRLSILIEKMFQDEINVTDEEVRKFYDDNESLYGDQSYDEIKDMLKEQIIQQRLSGRFSGWLNDKREESNIRYFVDYGTTN